MKSQFSEFTYGYALIEELSRHTNFTAVPIFPSLVEEGRTGGYDVGLTINGMPFFLQFKKSDYLARSNSKYYYKFSSPYYRFHLHALRHSQQHNLLLHLERNGNPVFYVAPAFHKNIELQNNYFNSKIVSSSIWIPPIKIGNLPDDNEHEICFNTSCTKVYLCSEPKALTSNFNYAGNSIINYLKVFKEEMREDFRKQTWTELYKKMEYIFRTYDSASFDKLSIFLKKEENIIVKTAKLARLGFDLDIVVIKEN